METDAMQDQPGGGHVELICGSMFSGNTEALLRRIRRAEIARRTIQIFKRRLDHRSGLDRLASRIHLANGRNRRCPLGDHRFPSVLRLRDRPVRGSRFPGKDEFRLQGLVF